MTIHQFAVREKLASKTEIEKLAFLAFFHLATKNVADFAIRDVERWFTELHFAAPNLTRLKDKMRRSREYVLVGDNFRLHARKIEQLRIALGYLESTPERPAHFGTILPAELFRDTRGYLECIAEQVNAAYESGIHDGCAVLMRRSIEILLILAFRHHRLEARICGANGQYDDLSTIISKAIPEPGFGFSKQCRECLDKFRTLGNFSAHKIEYNCKPGDIRNVALDYRAAFEELLYKAGLRR